MFKDDTTNGFSKLTKQNKIILLLLLLKHACIKYLIPTQDIYQTFHGINQNKNQPGSCNLQVQKSRSRAGAVQRMAQSVDGTVVRVLASHRCGSGLIPGPDVGMWVEFVVSSRPCSECLNFSRFSGFSPSTKINTSKF